MELKVISTGSKGNCYLLKPKQGNSILLECGVTFPEIKKALNYRIFDIEACLVTHEHMDHAKSSPEILDAGIGLYSSHGTMRKVEWRTGYKIIESGQQYEIGDFQIMPFDTIHDAQQPLGFFIYHPECGNIVFATDTKSIPVRFKDVRHWIIEANYSEEFLRKSIEEHKIKGYLANRIYENHMSLETCIETLKENDLAQTRTITLIHLSENNANGEVFKKQVAKEVGIMPNIAKKGLTVQLD